MGTQRLIRIVVVVALVAGGWLLVRRHQSDKGALHICVWSNYIPESVLSAFTKETGIGLRVSYMSSNEELFAKLRAGATGYDVIQPSDYMLRNLIKLGMLQKLDRQALPNIVHLDDYFRGLPFDPGLKYSVPFSLGITGITINTKKVKVDPSGVSWGMLFESPDPKHTSFLDDMREVFSASLIWKGRAANTVNMTALKEAQKRILDAKKKILLFSSEPRPLMLQDELTIAHSYSTDGVQTERERSEFKFFIPKEGAVVWTDNLAVLKSSPKLDQAQKFINYIMDPGVAYEIALKTYITTPNKTAKARLPKDYTDDPNLYPPLKKLKTLQYIESLEDTLKEMDQLWTELKT